MILLVEDDALVRRAVTRVLEVIQDGAVYPFASAEAAVAAIVERGGWDAVTAVLSDCDAPEPASGRDVLAAARESIPGARRILMSGRGPDDLDVVRCLASGEAHAFLHKPFDLEDLQAALGGEEV